MYKVIENGMEKMCSAEEAKAMIEAFNRRHHIFSLDEMWRTQKIIYLNDPAQPEKTAGDKFCLYCMMSGGSTDPPILPAKGKKIIRGKCKKRGVPGEHP